MLSWLWVVIGLLAGLPSVGLALVLAYRAIQVRRTAQQQRDYERYRIQMKDVQEHLADIQSPEAALPVAQLFKATTRNEVAALKNVIIETYGTTPEPTRKALTFLYESLGFVADDLQIIHNGTLEERARAAFRLGRLRCLSALDALERLSKHSSTELRLVAIWALTEIADPRCVKPVVVALSEANGWQLMQAANRLLGMHRDLTLPLMELLDSAGGMRERRERIMMTVLDLITDFGTEAQKYVNPSAGRQAALRLLESESVNLRTRAIRALTALGVESSQETEGILRALKDKSWEVRAVAARAIGELQIMAGLPGLQEAVSDKAWWVRHNAAYALKKLGDAGEIVLLQLLQSDDRFTRETVTQVLQSR